MLAMWTVLGIFLLIWCGLSVLFCTAWVWFLMAPERRPTFATVRHNARTLIMGILSYSGLNLWD